MNKENRLRMLKIVYAWLLKHGQFTTGKWSYYGGHYERLTRPASKKTMYLQEIPDDEVRAKIKSVGVNWDRVDEPVDESHSEFVSTFDESNTVSTTLGKLVLNDGTEVYIGTKENTLNLQMVALVLEMAEYEHSW